jgi:hypothetical protein
MPSSYTVNLGIQKPAPGEQEGTWGGTVNTDMDQLDQAIGGSVDVSLSTAGTSGSPNVIKITDPADRAALSDGRNAFIDIDDVGTGDLGADVYVQFTPEDSQRILYVRNSLTNQDLYIFQGNWNATRDYVINNGSTALVKLDGGGSTAATVTAVNINQQFDGSFDVSGNITASNLSGTNTGDNAGVTAVTGAAPITSSGGTTPEIGHASTAGNKHIPSGGATGNFLKYQASGTATWSAISTSDVSGYQVPAMYDNSGTPTLNAGITAEEYRTAIGAGTSSTVGTVTQVDGGNGLTGSITSSGALAVGAGQGVVVNANDVQLDYSGANNFVEVATDLEGSAIDMADTIIYNDATDGNLKKGLVSDLPGIGESGTVTAVNNGNGMNFTNITTSGTVTLGTPSSSTSTSSNAVTASSHTHAIDATIARIANPAFTGAPTAPTAGVGSNNTVIATTAFVNAEIANDAPTKTGGGASGTWGIAISGNAATATSATTATTAATVTTAAQPSITSLGTLTGLTVSGTTTQQTSIKLKERASAPSDTAAYGQIWCKTATPCQLWYTADDGTDFRLDSTGTISSVTINAGNGLTGGGTDSTNPVNLTVTMGTPGTLTGSTSNGVTATSHTHSIDSSIARIAGPTFTGTVTAPVFNTSSAKRYKDVLGQYFPVDSNLNLLNPVRYILKEDETRREQVGYIAEEVDLLFPEIVLKNSEGEVEGIDYAKLVVPAIERIKYLERQLKEQLKELEEKVNGLRF